jgi:hypothetical protein
VLKTIGDVAARGRRVVRPREPSTPIRTYGVIPRFPRSRPQR